MKVVIAGSRGFSDYTLLCDTMEDIVKECGPISEVVSGTARGADRLGERWAKDKGIAISRFRPDWDKLGKSAGYIRNKEMAEYADMVVLFWDTKSRGTKHMYDLSMMLKKTVLCYHVEV